MLELFETFKANVFPSMLKDFSEGLGLKTTGPFEKLNMGYSPLDGAWVSPERDVYGDIVGLLKRYDNGNFNSFCKALGQFLYYLWIVIYYNKTIGQDHRNDR